MLQTGEMQDTRYRPVWYERTLKFKSIPVLANQIDTAENGCRPRIYIVTWLSTETITAVAGFCLHCLRLSPSTLQVRKMAVMQPRNCSANKWEIMQIFCSVTILYLVALFLNNTMKKRNRNKNVQIDFCVVLSPLVHIKKVHIKKCKDNQ